MDDRTRISLHEREAEREKLALMAQYTPAQRSQALTLFISDNLEPTAIALQLGLPLAIIESFAREDGWLELRKDIEVNLVALTEANERQIILRERIEVRRRHLESAKKIEDAALRLVENGDPVMNRPLGADALKKAAEAFSSAATISARAAGLGDGEKNEPGAVVNVRVSPVIMVGAGPRAPRTTEVMIDVRDEGPDPASKMGAGEPRAPARVPAGVPEKAPDPATPGDRKDPGAPSVQTVRVDREV